MRTKLLPAGFLAVALLTALSSANAYILEEIGQQDWFVHNQYVTGGVAAFDAAQVGEPATMRIYGSDPYGPNADITWTHVFAPPAPGGSQYLEFGLVDLDSGTDPPGGVRDVVEGFWLDGFLQDDSFFLTPGPSDQCSTGLYTTAVPSALLADGTLTVRLLVAGPGLSGGDYYLPYNSAGLDFARLTSTTAPVPEPSTLALLGLGVAALTGLKRRRKAT